jgi:HEAT repeat protein
MSKSIEQLLQMIAEVINIAPAGPRANLLMLVEEKIAANPEFKVALQSFTALSDERLQRDYFNYLKWTEPLLLMLALIDNEIQALRVVDLAIKVDWMLGARFIGAVKDEFQSQAVGYIDAMAIPLRLKCQLWVASQAKTVVRKLINVIYDSKDQDFQFYAIGELARFPTERATRGLLIIFKDLDKYVSIHAAKVLVEIGAAEALLTVFQDPDIDDDCRNRAANALTEIGGTHVVNELLMTIKKDPNKDVCVFAAMALGKIGGIRAIKGLIEILKGDSREEIRCHAAEALGENSSPPAVKGLISALNENPDNSVRKCIVESLGKIGGSKVVNGLLIALNDIDYEIRIIAAKALGGIRGNKSIPGLLISLGDRDSADDDDSEELKKLKNDFRAFVAEALGEIGSTRAITGLVFALQEDSDSNVRSCIAEALGKIGSTRAIAGLISVLLQEDSDNNVRLHAVEALWKIEGDRAAKGLAPALDDNQQQIINHVAEALSIINRNRIAKELLDNEVDGNVPGCAPEETSDDDEFEEFIDPIDDISDHVVQLAAKPHDGQSNVELIKELVGADRNETVESLRINLRGKDRHIAWQAAEKLEGIGDPRVIGDLWRCCYEFPDSRYWEIISAIQNRCQFYNYEIKMSLLTVATSITLEPLASGPIEMFISYSHKDEALLKKLVEHLASLKRHNKITAWHDRAIEAGEEWEVQLASHLESARIILLLISPPFIASNYCYDKEMRRAIERHDNGTASVIPIILRPCDWKYPPFSKLQGLPINLKPVTTWPNRDSAFLEVVEGITRVVDKLVKN